MPSNWTSRVLAALTMVLVFAACTSRDSTSPSQEASAHSGTTAVASSLPATVAATLDDAELARLITQLGDGDYQVREAANKQLMAAGPSARSALKKARQETRDAEVRSRLDLVLVELSLWNGQETVAQYAQRMGIWETVLTLNLGDKVTMKVILVPPGKFLMGSPPTEKSRNENEVQHEVTISKPFYMGVTDVTVDQFAAFVKDTAYKTDAEKAGWSIDFAFKEGKLSIDQIAGLSWCKPSFAQKGDHPVVHVSWNDAQAFCAWLSKKTGKTVELPTEAQWEYACRAGTTTAYPWGDDPDNGKGWANGPDQSQRKEMLDYPDESFFSWDDGFVFTAPVASFKANAFGLYDMIGNVQQWCQDWFKDYAKHPVTDPVTLAGDFRILRGGAWFALPSDCRSAYRFRIPPPSEDGQIGFRVVVIPGAPAVD